MKPMLNPVWITTNRPAQVAQTPLVRKEPEIVSDATCTLTWRETFLLRTGQVINVVLCSAIGVFAASAIGVGSIQEPNMLAAAAGAILGAFDISGSRGILLLL